METSDLISQTATVMEAVRLEGAQSDDFIPDEIAICFPSDEALMTFVAEAVGDYGLDRFNSVPRDHMHRIDRLGEGFDVHFEFLRLPGRNWRIEAMSIFPGGIAALHEKALRDSGGEPVIIHVSWKCHNLDFYADTIRHMPSQQMFRKAEYANSYGIFSYFSTNGGPMYWKPRVNLRDGSS